MRLVNKPMQMNNLRTTKLPNRLWRGVTLQLFLVAVLPLTTLVLLVTFGSLQLHHKAMRSLVADRNLLSVQSTALSLEKEIYHRGEILVLLTKSDQMSNAAENVLDNFAEELAIFDGGVALVGDKGQVAAISENMVIQQISKSTDWRLILASMKDTPIDIPVFLPVISSRN